MKVLALIVLSLISISYCESAEDESEVDSALECKKSDAYLEKIMERLTEMSEVMGKKGKGRMNGHGWGRKDKSGSSESESNEDLDNDDEESDEKPGKSRGKGKGKGKGGKKRKGNGRW